MNKIKELINELNKASELYYNGQESPFTDAEFDIKLNELKELEQKEKIIYSNSPTIKVGAPVLSELKKVQISNKPMLSLDKVHSAKEIINFNSSYDLIASIKCDGLSVRLIYENTDLVSANTRGNGFEGGDITEHVKHFLNVPLKIKKKRTYIIDGEAIIYDSDFAIVNKNKEFKNNRNTASGALALLDLSIVDKRRLSFIAWDIIEGGCSDTFYHYNLEEAEELGFTVVPALALDCTKIEEKEIDDINQTLLIEAKEKGIPCDGVVWRINDIQAGKKMGQTAHHFLNAVAWKPTDDEYETELIDIEWSMGKSGVLTPVAIFKPIEIDGTIVERASLHNFSIMRETLGDYPDQDQKIWVIKSNQIIPQITRAIKNDIPHDHTLSCFPNLCPYCAEPTELRESDSGVLNYYCSNSSCSGKLANRIDHFCGKKGLDIKGISLATIEKLINWGWLNGLADIFKLDEHRTEWISKAGFGEASVGKTLNNIASARTQTSLSAFISAISIPLVGTTVAKEITRYYPTWEEFRAAVGSDWSTFEGFGPEISNAINNFDYTEADEIAEFIKFAEIQPSESQTEVAAIKDKVFCVTGKLTTFRNRDELKKDIEFYGGKVVGSISSKVNYLINNDFESNSSKNVAAKAANIPIITEQEYLNLRDNAQ